MEDAELALLPNWRFTKVIAGGKKPYPAGWQNAPLTLSQIPQQDNIGVLSGPFSGIMAIDFDGAWAFEWWEQNIGGGIPDTVAWSSGKEGRCQFAYAVKEEFWHVLRTKKFGNGKHKPELEGIEFRWAGAQSVLPPSIHPDTGKGYEWINAPSTVKVAELPDAVIIFLLSQETERLVVTAPKPQGNINTIKPSEFEQLEALLRQLHGYYPVLDYDTWLKISFATASEIGDAAAAMLLAQFWPEQRAGEYLAHLKGRDASRSPTMGTLVYMVKEKQQPLIPKLKINNNNKF